MAIDRWFIGGGAEHTPESARRLVYAATSGAEGVGGVGDLKVEPLAVPGGGVRVLIGSGLIRSRYVGGETQTYMGTVYEQETVAIGATGSGAGRSDLVVMRVEDPHAAGSPWDAPTDLAAAPYVHIRVISGVPANTTRVQDVPGRENDTAIALARIDLPASTGTVNTAHIVDLRAIAQPRRVEGDARIQVATQPHHLISSTPVQWPPVETMVDIPQWATEAYLDGFIFGAETLVSSTAGWLWMRIGEATTVDTARTYYNQQVPGAGARFGFPIGGKIAIPEALRGQRVKLRPIGARNGGTGYLAANTDAQVRLSWAFVEGVA